jgi:hypothetical protein
MSETSALVEVERAGLTMMFALFATSREVEAAGSGDRRYADAIKRIAGTLDLISDEVVTKLSAVNEASECLLTTLIAARVEQIGFALPLYADALSFIAPIEAQVDAILQSARSHVH